MYVDKLSVLMMAPKKDMIVRWTTAVEGGKTGKMCIAIRALRESPIQTDIATRECIIPLNSSRIGLALGIGYKASNHVRRHLVSFFLLISQLDSCLLAPFPGCSSKMQSTHAPNTKLSNWESISPTVLETPQKWISLSPIDHAGPCWPWPSHQRVECTDW